MTSTELCLPTSSLRTHAVLLWLCSVLGVFAAPESSLGQSHSLSFERYSVADGLSSYTVTAALQDQHGFLWFATLDGLNRFNGYSFTSFKHDPGDPHSLSSNYIHLNALYEDRAGDLWIGTRSGLNRLDPATERFQVFTHVPADSTSLSHDHVHAVVETERGTLWVGTGKGLNRMTTGERFVRYKHRPGDACSIPGNVVTALTEDTQGRLWVGTMRGLSQYDAARDCFVSYTYDPTSTVSLPADYVTALHVSHDGTLWVGTWGGGVAVRRLDDEYFTRYVIPQAEDDAGYEDDLDHDIITSFAEDSQGDMWVGTWGGGIVQFDGERHDAVAAASLSPVSEAMPQSAATSVHTHRLEAPESLASNKVSSLTFDRSGLLWAGTWEGVSKEVAVKAFTAYTYQPNETGHTLSHPRVQAVHESKDGQVWVGTLGGGLNRIDRRTGRIDHYQGEATDSVSLDSGDVWGLTEDSEGALWIGTGGEGLYRYDPDAGRFQLWRHRLGDTTSLASNLIYTVHADSQDHVWIGTVDAGLDRFDPDTGTFTHYRHTPEDSTSLSHNSVFSVYEEHSGVLWLSTVGGGLNRLDTKQGAFSHYGTSASTSEGTGRARIFTVAEDSAGTLWLGSMGGGLGRLDRRTGTIQWYTTHDGLAHDNVTCILPGEVYDLWVGTLNGLSHFDIRNETFVNYDATDGLPGAVVHTDACQKGRDSELFFGTANGLVVFDPQDITPSTYQPPVAVEAIEVFGRPATFDSAATHLSRVTLPYDQNFIGFRFAALDFTAPTENEYAYRLEGLDSDWVHAGKERHANYPNLQPGAYTFRVKGTNSDGLWSPHIASVRLIITPPFWRTWWFALVVVAGMLGLAGAVHQYRVHHLLEVERTRQRIAEDLHDDVGSEIGSLAFSLELEGRQDQLDEDQRRTLLDFSQRARQVSHSLRETIWLVDAENDTLINLVDRLHEVAYQTIPDGRLSYEAPALVPPVTVSMEARRNVYLIAKEALYNAAQHAGAQHVRMDVEVSGNVLCVSITDDGEGFDPEHTGRGQGLDNMIARAARIGARLTIESEPGAGTAVHLEAKMA